MTKGQVIFGTASALIIAGTFYFGFVKKYGNGLTWYQKVIAPDPLANLDRAGAELIIAQASGGTKPPASYNDDYVIARAKALYKKEPFFFLNNGKNKYNTITGKAVSL